MDEAEFAQDPEEEVQYSVDWKLKLSILWQGIGTGIVVQMIFTDINFFIYEFPDHNPAYSFPMFMFIPQLVGQILTFKFVNQIPFKCGVISIGIFRMCMAFVMPFMINGLVSTGHSDIAWYLTLGLMVTHSLFSVMINTLQTGFIAQFPETNTSFMSLYMVGQVTNAIIVLLI